ncbi:MULTISPECIES: HAMP domain-containing sensor histidine kinase [unclassified Leptolyngbya]|uniref:sensor histidine kinase n=1 Tax=unclassified Leptolyngbya TaxID=2650499 RepID=UPI001687A7EF|nr:MULTISPECIES: HAMP domain-containing sensor histidine kinase [unclassified Leptolyngbya]MBD1913361.1 HAMP domain-containing histidine kinase [Leptolyngbya sp. FACHB-8]MBD2158708.1 HAMP domain-containing histidine kinase [Leptolyngbya sp. FACHB-16]
MRSLPFPNTFRTTWLHWQESFQHRQQMSGRVASEFLVWRRSFIGDRVRLLAWMVLFAVSISFTLNMTFTIPMLNAAGDPRMLIVGERLRRIVELALTEIVCGVIGVALTYHPLTRKQPEKVVLLITALSLFPSQVLSIVRGEAQFDADIWLLYYAAQAIVIPVKWELHCLSQAIVIGYSVIPFLMGWRDPDVLFSATYVLGGLYIGLMCVVANVGVFLHEQSIRREHDLRQQLRVFLHAVSHDLRNPVIGMGMTLKSFLNPSGRPAQIPQDLLEQMIKSGDRQLELINSLLEAHVTELHGVTLHPQPIQLEALVDSILCDFQPFFKQEKTSITSNLSVNLPTVHADALHLRRVYENLITNALKYNRPGLRITLDAEVIAGNLHKKVSASSRWLRCTVSDDGAGMTPQQCAHLFELYTRGPNKRQSLSLGLGLYTCRQIITAHRGEIGVQSIPEVGSTFWFTLPLDV